MHRLRYLLCLTTLLVSATANADDNPQLWILSGQSNACGRAKLPGPAADERVTMFDPKTGEFVVAQDPLPGMGTTGTGPWVAAAQAVAPLAGDITMLGYANGGKPISFWHPGKPGYVGLMPRIERAGQGAGVFLWYQGENNSAPGTSGAEYVKELQEHFARVRKAADNPEMLVVVVQLGPDTRTDNSGYMTLREAQRQYVAGDPQAILVPALGRTLKDTVHLDNAGYRELGAEIGRALLRHRFGKTDVAWPGPVLDAAVIDEDRRSVVAHFAEVDELAGCDATDFALIDEEGTVRCTMATPGKTTVTLIPERVVRLPARLIYAFGQNPQASLVDEAGNRAPAVQIPVAAGDTPEDVPTAAANGAGK